MHVQILLLGWKLMCSLISFRRVLKSCCACTLLLWDILLSTRKKWWEKVCPPTCQTAACCARCQSCVQLSCRPPQFWSQHRRHTDHIPQLRGRATKQTGSSAMVTTTPGPSTSSTSLSHISIGAQVLNGHLTGFRSTQSYFSLHPGTRLLPQYVLVGQIIPSNRVPQDQFPCVGATGKQPIWGTTTQNFSVWKKWTYSKEITFSV